MTSFFPSRTVSLYMGRMFLVRPFGILAGLVVLGHAADAIVLMFRVPEACACQTVGQTNEACLKEQRRPDFSAARLGPLIRAQLSTVNDFAGPGTARFRGKSGGFG